MQQFFDMQQFFVIQPFFGLQIRVISHLSFIFHVGLRYLLKNLGANDYLSTLMIPC